MYMDSLPNPQLLTRTIVNGLQIYFDRSCGMSLLYRFERQQYAQIRKKYITGPQVRPSWFTSLQSLYSSLLGQDWRIVWHWNVLHIWRRTLITNARLVPFDWRSASIWLVTVSLPQMVANSQMDTESIGFVRDYVNELLRYVESGVMRPGLTLFVDRYLEDNKDSIFQREYDTPSQSYGNTARS